MIFDPLLKAWKASDFESVTDAFLSGRSVRVSGIKGSSRSLYFHQLQQHLQMPLLVLTSSTKQAEDDYSDLTFLSEHLGNTNPVYFPAHDTEPYQGISPHPQISVMRMQALWHLTTDQTPIIVAPLSAAVQWMAPRENFGRSLLTIEWGDEKSPVELAALLRSFGYKEKDLVTSRGEFALRGGILDLFSPAEAMPVRLEFFGN